MRDAIDREIWQNYRKTYRGKPENVEAINRRNAIYRLKNGQKKFYKINILDMSNTIKEQKVKT